MRGFFFLYCLYIFVAPAEESDSESE